MTPDTMTVEEYRAHRDPDALFDLVRRLTYTLTFPLLGSDYECPYCHQWAGEREAIQHLSSCPYLRAWKLIEEADE